MALITPSQTSFNAGLWGKRASGRTDLPPYRQACSVLRNFIPRAVGSAGRRPGTKFVSEVKDSTMAVRLVPFIFDENTAYTLEFGDQYVRFYRNGARIEDPPGTPVELATPWLETELFDIQWAQDASTLVVTHTDHQPRLIQRTDDVTWAITTLDFVYGPYLTRGEVYPGVIARKASNAAFQAELEIGGANGEFRTGPTTRTVTCADGTPFVVGRDEGRLIVVGDGWSPSGGESYAVGVISVVNSTSSIDVDFFDGQAFSIDPKPTPSWWMQAYWEQGSYVVWPSSCTFYKERLVLAGGTESPDTGYCSRQGSLTDFDNWAFADGPPAGSAVNTDQITVVDTSAVPIAISYPEVNLIQWIRGTRDSLLIGTSRAVFSVDTPSTEGFNPNSVLKLRQNAAVGSMRLPAQAINDAIHFISQDRISVSRMGFSLEADAFVPYDLNRFNDEILRPGSKDIAVSYFPEPVLWIATTDGRLVGCTIDDQQRVLAWHEHVLGGTGVTHDYGEVESVAVIPASDQSYDELWLVVRRSINGSNVRYIEYFQQALQDDQDQAAQYYVDCGGTPYSGAATTSYSGLDHLIGETVDVLADGSAEVQLVVDGSGAITLEDSASDILAGLPYVAELQTLPFVINDPQGGSMAKRHRFSHVYARLVRSQGGQFAGGDPLTLDYRAIAYRKIQDLIGQPPPLFTGVLMERNLSEVSQEPILAVRHASPTNFEIVALGGYLDAASR